VAQRVPIGRIGEDEDMAGAAVFLASRAGDYVVGETCGGRLAFLGTLVGRLLSGAGSRPGRRPTFLCFAKET
jgi:hypothetical protein